MRKILFAAMAFLIAGAGCSASIGTAKKGVDAPGNQPELVKIVQDLKTNCKYETKFGVGGYDVCPPYEQLKENAKNYENGFATVLNFIEDSEPIVRYASAHALALGFYGEKYFSNSEDFGRLLKALKAETDETIARDLSGAVPHFVSYTKGELTDAVAFIKDKSHPVLEARKEAVRLSGSTQFKKQEWFNALANIAENNLETEAIRTSAIYAIARASIEGQKTMAKQALENISKSDNAKLAADAKKALGFIK